MCVNWAWATVCEEFWDNDDARVICHQLGYSSYGMYKSSHKKNRWFTLLVCSVYKYV